MNIDDLLRASITDHAERAEPPAYDFGPIEAGVRRRARIRTAIGAGAAAAVLAVAVVSVGALRGDDSLDRIPAPPAPRSAVWTDADGLHLDGTTYPLARGSDGTLLVLTSEGVVYGGGRTSSWFQPLDGPPREIPVRGRADGAPNSPFVVWFTVRRDHYVFHAYDLRSGEMVATTSFGPTLGLTPEETALATLGTTLFSIDETTAYFRGPEGAWRYDWRTDDEPTLIGDTSGVVDMASDVRAETAGRIDGEGLARIRFQASDTTLSTVESSFPLATGLSTDGASYLFSMDVDEKELTTDVYVVDTLDGERVRLDVGDQQSVVLAVWGRDDQITVVAGHVRSDEELEDESVWTCERVEGSCVRVADLAGAIDDAGFPWKPL